MNEYGFQTEEIKAFVERVRNVTPEQVKEFVSAWSHTSFSEYHYVRKIASTTAQTTVPTYIQKAVWDVVWDTARDAVRDIVQGTLKDPEYSAFPYALGDIALALVVKDKISEKNFNVLYGPWNSVMG